MLCKRMFQPLVWLSLVLSALLLGLTLLSSGARLMENTTSDPLHFIGDYKQANSTQLLPFQNGTELSADTLTSFTLYGHFDREVKPNTQITMRINNLQVQILVNGESVFTFGDVHPSFVHSGGNVWTSFSSAGILPTDIVEIHLSNFYANEVLSSFDDFFANLNTGSEYPVYRNALFGKGSHLLIGVLVFLLGLAMLCVSFYAQVLKLSRAHDYVYLSAFVIASGIWMCINYRFISLIIPYPAFYQSLEMLCMALMPIFLMRYLITLVTESQRKLCSIVIYMILLVAVVSIVLQLLGIVDLATLTGLFSIIDMVGIVIFTVCLIRSFRIPSDKETRTAILPVFILFIGALLNISNYFFTWRTSGMFYSLAFLLFAFLEMFRLVRALRDGVRRNSEYALLENELIQSRIAVMLSQIKPHFLYNALNSISALCLTDPLMADQAITSLSNYLRGNIRSLEQNVPVPFEQELDHIKYYVRLEQLRYGEKLRVVYAINIVDFEVPTLSLQTLVENAIRHGVSPKPEGGLVVVQTERDGDFSVVRIIDNGVGFDPDMHSQNPDSIGLANAKKRMEVMMNAVFDIQSIPGKGTTISIRIPDVQKKGKV